MVPLDGPWSESATVGGMVAANINGSRRRLYGTARDLVIGMQFATMDGKLVQSGGMVVKNVAGLDMAKLLIGSFGTLAAITKVNFKLIPIPPVSRTLLFSFEDLKSAMEARNAAIQGVLTPVAVDLLNPIVAAQLNLKGYVLALLFSGNQAVIERSSKEAEKLGRPRALSAAEDQKFWSDLAALTPRHLDKFKEGAVVRVSTTLSECGTALGSIEGPGHALAASGIVRAWFTRPDAAARWLDAALKRGWKGVVEYSGESARGGMTLWPNAGSDFEIMKRIKLMFDPESLLNSGRFYGRF
jgi:glycolate oxidase FAD binding subunit